MRKFLLLTVFTVSSIFSIQVGEKLSNLQIKDSEDRLAKIPGLGSKVLTIFYTDPDVKDQNDPFADLLKTSNLKKTKYSGVGIANLKDTWKPNAIIRAVVRSKEKKYKIRIFTDPSYIVKKGWKLGSCDGYSVIIIVDKNGIVKYIKKGALNSTERANAIKLIKKLIG